MCLQKAMVTMKKFKEIDWDKVITLKRFAVLLIGSILLYHIIALAFELSRHRLVLVDTKTSNRAEQGEQYMVNNKIVTIKVIPSNNDLPTAVISGEGFDYKTEHTLLQEINHNRKEIGLSPLSFDICLERSARLRSLEMSEHEYFEHERPNGDNWVTAITEDVGISYVLFGENLATITNKDTEHPLITAKEWFTMWENSGSHYELMMSEEYTHGAIGIYVVRTEDGFSAIATAHFANENKTPTEYFSTGNSEGGILEVA